MEGLCRLCQKESDLRLSHLHPDFAIKWLRETGNGYFRQATDPNKRQQDGPKYYLLCEECEQRFSLAEKYFAENIFHPYLNRELASCLYDERLFYFSISYLWRSLIVQIEKDVLKGKPFEKLGLEVEENWRRFLLDPSMPPKFSDIHLFFTNITKDGAIPVKRFNSYLSRGLDVTVVESSSSFLAYAKFARFCFFGYLTPYDSSQWVNTKISPEGGELLFPQEIGDGHIGSFLIDRAREGVESYEQGINEKSKAAIEKSFKKMGDAWADKDVFKVQEADNFPGVINRSSYPIQKMRVGRNEPCPCGSGLKYKKCHGKP